jgi:predicted O-linked N-acetylglucosamine transferase (SPINDLY family)
VAASILTSAGLPELVTGNLSDYRTLALRLATHPDLLRSITEKLACNRLNAPLFDTTRFARQLENAYAEMWQIYAAGEVPRQIEVAAEGLLNLLDNI